MKKIWELTINISTITWVIIFVVSFFTEKLIINQLLNIISGIFIFELIIIFFGCKKKTDFFRTNWFDLLMLIPFCKIFRFSKLIKIKRVTRLSKLAKSIRVKGKSKFVKKIPETVDLINTLQDKMFRK